MNRWLRWLLVCWLPLLCLPAVGDDGPPDPHRDEAYAAHEQRLRERLGDRLAPRGPFRMRRCKPFIVLTDGGDAALERWCERTIQWSCARLRRAYFSKDPDRILEVWLCKDEASYRKHAKALFDDEPDTPYGYYSSAHGALVMNIATGGGTLVHEMVHVYVEADFPACPVWLNEGLGSLFEACREERGHIVGLLNWRLPILQDAIRRGPLPTLQQLTALDPGAFYGEGQDVHYGMARYLCYHLQEEGKLREYYEAARTRQGEDPTGYDTLVRSLGEEDMAAFQRRWEAWVATLEYGG